MIFVQRLGLCAVLYLQRGRNLQEINVFLRNNMAVKFIKMVHINSKNLNQNQQIPFRVVGTSY